MSARPQYPKWLKMTFLTIIPQFSMWQKITINDYSASTDKLVWTSPGPQFPKWWRQSSTFSVSVARAGKK